MCLSVFLSSYRAPFSVVVRLLFSSAGPFVCQEEAFNTRTLGVNNRFDLPDKPACVSLPLKVFVHACVRRFSSSLSWQACVISCFVDNANCLWLEQPCDKLPNTPSPLDFNCSAWLVLLHINFIINIRLGIIKRTSLQVRGKRVPAFLLAKHDGSNPHVPALVIWYRSRVCSTSKSLARERKVRQERSYIRCIWQIIYRNTFFFYSSLTVFIGAAEVCLRACWRMWHLLFLSFHSYFPDQFYNTCFRTKGGTFFIKKETLHTPSRWMEEDQAHENGCEDVNVSRSERH